MQTTAQDLIERAAKYDPSLAADIRAFAKAREFGLVFEHNRPEDMRLYGKKISKGDTVHILASRGKAEKPENRVPWRVARIAGGSAHLESIDNAEVSCDADLSELVAVAAFEEPIYAGLKEVGRVERGGDRPYQVIINGENYHALEALLFAYAGKVDCIYIDPPYNTGARDWKYNNDYVDGSDEYRHSKWLAFMERRLLLARQLLNPKSSVLIVTIDEKEYLRLGMLLEQLFRDARIQMVTTLINPAGVSRNNEFARTDEYIFFVQFGESKVERLPLEDEWRINADDKRTTRLMWSMLIRTGTNSLRADRPNLFYPIFVSEDGKRIVDVGQPLPINVDRTSVEPLPGTRVIWPIKQNLSEGNWQVSPEALLELRDKGFVKLGRFSERGMAISYLKRGEQNKVENGLYEITGHREDGSIISENEYRSIIPGTNWRIPSHDASRNGTNMVSTMLKRRFPFPKSLYAVEDALRFYVANKPDALIVDFFSGSGTTAHAVMRLNHQDQGRRRCICITNNEVSDDETRKMTKQGLRQSDPEWEKYGICESITKPRIDAAITGLTPEGELIRGDYLPDAKEVRLRRRQISMIDYLNPEMMRSHEKKAIAKKKKVLTLLTKGSLPQRLLDENPDYVLSESSEYAVLFNDAEAEQWIEQLEDQSQIRIIYIVTDNSGLFRHLKAKVEELLGEYEEEVLVPFPMSDGFEENAIFFDLTYQNPVVVDLDGAYEEIAPLLWMRAGCKGPIIATRGDGTYELSETYAILFDYAFAQDFVMELDAMPEIQTVYVVTDDEGRYQSINQALKGRDVVQLYESYLRSFQIAAEGALI